MELYESLLTKLLQSNPVLLKQEEKRFDSICFHALEEIKSILETPELSDFDCIERIIEVYEELGAGCGTRHDF